MPHIAAVGINICYRCEQELTRFNEIQNRVEGVGSVFAYAFTHPCGIYVTGLQKMPV